MRNTLFRLSALILVFCTLLTAASCGKKEEPEASTAVSEAAETVPAEPSDEPEETGPAQAEPEQETEIPDDRPANTYAEEGKVLLDNDICRITLGAEFEESNCLGFKVFVENKCDRYIFMTVEYSSVDGYMTYMNFIGSDVAPGEKSNGTIEIYPEDACVSSVYELKNVQGYFLIGSNEDGGNFYGTNEGLYPFFIEGNANGGVEVPTEGYTKCIADDENVLILLGGTYQDEYTLGYKAYIENRTEYNIFPCFNYATVNGIDTDIYMSESVITPGMKALVQLRVFPDGHEFTSEAELTNTECELDISYNSEITSYIDTLESFHVKFDDAWDYETTEASAEG